jgi:hypothetical protein
MNKPKPKRASIFKKNQNKLKITEDVPLPKTWIDMYDANKARLAKIITKDAPKTKVPQD